MNKSPAEHTALRGFCRFLSHSPVKKGFGNAYGVSEPLSYY